jgi:hypothetical protein
LAFIIFHQAVFAVDYPGLPTRDQNPLLQGYFIPAMPVASSDGWAVAQSLYFTNTYQLERSADEDLIIDVENTRYDFQATWAHRQWRFNLNIPLIRNSPGFLDQTIVGWHDFFGLPQGGRDQAQNDQIKLLYQNTGGSVIDSTQSETANGDIQLAAGYQLSGSNQLWLGIELPTGSASLMSNGAIDFALWISHVAPARENLQPFGLLGVSFPADDGLFENQLRRQFVFGQLGLLYAWRPNYLWFVQADFHSSMVKHSTLDALGHSLQAQFGLRLPQASNSFQLDLFFSEDIYPGHAPDITFGLRLSPRL